MLNRKIIFLFSWIFLGLIQPCYVSADIVVLKNHNEMEGLIVSENDQSVVLKVRSGSITFPKSQIKSIIRDREQGQKTLELSSQKSLPAESLLPQDKPVYRTKHPSYKINKKIGDAHGIKIRKDQFFIDGKPFFIRGVGYSPMRPGMSPGQEITKDLYERDFEKIRRCGFNTIRLWGKGSELLLKTALEYDLYVIQAIWIDPGGTFDYSGFIYQSVAHARMMAEMSKPYPNVLMYLVMNEPHVKQIMKAGLDKTLDLLRQVRDAVKSVDPDRPISISNFVSTVWLDQELWDVVCFNAYGYYPLSINKDMGYFGYLTWLKDQYAADKPLLITEYGYSVSPTGPGGFGYGGNTEDEQAQGLVSNFDAISQSGAIGGCLFEWCDEWWKSGHPGIHDDHPEEWFGLMSFKGFKDKVGHTRKAFDALMPAMKMAVLHPRQHSVVFDKISLAMNVTSDIDKLEYRFEEDGEWRDLSQPSPWFKQDIDVTSLSEGPHQLRVRALIGQTEVTKKIISFVKSTRSSLNPPYQLTLLLDKESYVVGDELRLQLLVKDSDLQPVRNVPVSLSLFNCLTSNSRRWTGHTDKNGMFSQSYLALGGRFDWYYLVTAGAQQKYLGTKFPLSAVKTVFVEGGLKHIVRKNADIPKRISRIVIDGKLEPYWSQGANISLLVDQAFMEGLVDDADDLSVKGYLFWDEKNIFMAFDIHDDYPAVNKFEKDMIWNGDGIEFYISVKPENIPETGYSRADFQIMIGANGQMWIYNQSRGGTRNGPPIDSELAVTKSPDGYVIEARISTVNFDRENKIVFKEGFEIGLDMAVADADLTGEREGKMIWNGMGENYKNSILWGRGRLVGPEK